MRSLHFSIIAVALLAFVNSVVAQPRPAVPEGVNVLRDIAYVENGHERNRLDLYLPEKVRGPLPVVVWIHGGGWSSGSKDGCRAAWLSGKGYAVASINYRLSQQAVFPAQIEDCKAAIRWLRANAGKYHLDADHVGVWGASAGGHLVALLGTTGGVKELDGKGGNSDQSSRVQCVVDWFGPTDMLRIETRDDKPDTPVAKLIGGTVHENREKARKASPLYYVGKESAPFLIMHGDKDPLVPLKQSEILAEALAKAGVEVKLQVIKDNGHGGPGFTTPESRKLIEDFFDKHLKGREGGGKTGTIPGKPRVLVTISKETTYITGPLRKDGYPDYIAALNERFKKGVTPENNAAVLFWQAVGPSELNPRIRTRYFEMLEMPPPADQGDYFVSFDKYMRRLKDANDPRLTKPTAEKPEPEWDQLQRAMRRPWSTKELPLLDEWLAANEKPLALLAKATKRPRRYDPLLCVNSDQGIVIAILMDASEQSREVGRALGARAMLKLKVGKVEEAWDDLLACHRLARLQGQGPTIIEALVAIAVDGCACAGDQAVLQSAALSTIQIAKMREDLVSLPPMAKMAGKIDIGERFIFLDCVGTCARDGFGSLSLFNGMALGKSVTSTFVEITAHAATNWDVILRMGNTWYDRIVAAGRKPTAAGKRFEIAGIERDVKGLEANEKDPKSFGVSLFANGPSHAVSKRIGDILIGLLLPALSSAFNTEDRGVMQFELTRLGFALAAYRADHDAYPDQFSDLAPRYVTKVPGDIFADDGPLHYKRQDKGYVIYSVGINGKDDGGRGYNDRKADEDWDDLSVRVP
jgi:acetyl esterase/lipase